MSTATSSSAAVRTRGFACRKARGAEVRAAHVGGGETCGLGRYRVRVEPAPAGAVAASRQRTEGLARELVRAMLGANAAPTLEIGRGKVASAHAEIRRGWDGTR